VTSSGSHSDGHSPTRVCLVSEMIFPDSVGGLEIHAYEVAQRLIRSGMPVVVLTRYQRADLPAREQVGSVPFVRIRPVGLLKGRGWRALGPILLLMARVGGWLLRHRREFDVVHIHGVKVLSFPAVWLSRLGILPCVIKVDSPMEIWEEISDESLRRMGPLGARLRPRLRQVRASTLRRADRFIAISSEIVDGLVNMGVPADRIARIPNGVDTDRFQPVTAAERARLRAELGLPADRIVVNFTGRLSRAKGLPMLLEVWRQLMASEQPVHLALVGSGRDSFDDCEDDLRTFITQHRLAETISMPGAVADVGAWLQAADVFVLPSEYEGLPLALLEAMACGLPAIATRVGAISEVIHDRDNGVLVPARDAEALCRALEWALAHPERTRELGARARDTVVQRFSLNAVTSSYAVTLREAGRRPSQARAR